MHTLSSGRLKCIGWLCGSQTMGRGPPVGQSPVHSADDVHLSKICIWTIQNCFLWIPDTSTWNLSCLACKKVSNYFLSPCLFHYYFLQDVMGSWQQLCTESNHICNQKFSMESSSFDSQLRSRFATLRICSICKLGLKLSWCPGWVPKKLLFYPLFL